MYAHPDIRVCALLLPTDIQMVMGPYSDHHMSWYIFEKESWLTTWYAHSLSNPFLLWHQLNKLLTRPGHSCPSMYTPFLDSMLQYPNFHSHHQAAHSVIMFLVGGESSHNLGKRSSLMCLARRQGVICQKCIKFSLCLSNPIHAWMYLTKIHLCQIATYSHHNSLIIQ